MAGLSAKNKVLIVAKCNVNLKSILYIIICYQVLIVAKCNVNIGLCSST